MKSRIYWIDVVKAVAICMVILAHVLWAVENGGGGSGLASPFLTINRMVASLGVPLFMMVSGALLFGKRFQGKADVLSFYKHGLLPLFITAEVWIVIYCLFNLQPFSFKELLLCLAFVHKPEVHLWYVRLIVIYYLAIPFLNLLREKCKMGFLALLLVIALFTFCYNGWLIYQGSDCPTSSSRSYFCYLVYMSLGWWISRVPLSRLGNVLSVLLVILGGQVLYLSLIGNSYFLWYDNPMIAVIVFGLFYLLRTIFVSRNPRGSVVNVSKMSYGIYLSHFILIYVVGRIMHVLGDWNEATFYLSLLIVLFVDVFLIAFIKKCFGRMTKIVFRY